jgi:flavodoxin
MQDKVIEVDIMKIVVIYDSMHGNTEIIARSMGDTIGNDVSVIKASEVNLSNLDSVDFIVVGSPTQGGRPTQPIQDFFRRIPDSAVKGVRFAVFDTRIPAKWVKIFGFAAGKMNKALKRKGGNPVISPEVFYVEGTKGPIKDGELERANNWIRECVSNLKE